MPSLPCGGGSHSTPPVGRSLLPPLWQGVRHLLPSRSGVNLLSPLVVVRLPPVRRSPRSASGWGDGSGVGVLGCWVLVLGWVGCCVVGRVVGSVVQCCGVGCWVSGWVLGVGWLGDWVVGRWCVVYRGVSCFRFCKSSFFLGGRGGRAKAAAVQRSRAM